MPDTTIYKEFSKMIDECKTAEQWKKVFRKTKRTGKLTPDEKVALYFKLFEKNEEIMKRLLEEYEKENKQDGTV